MNIKNLSSILYLTWHLILDSSGCLPKNPNLFSPSTIYNSRGFFSAQNITPLVPKEITSAPSVFLELETNETSMWQEHIKEIDKLNKNPNIKKVDCETIKEIFNQNTKKYYSSFKVNDYEVFYNQNLFNLEDKYKINGIYRTNLEIIQNGFNPYNVDGEKMSYHHLIKADPGPLVMLSVSFHQKYNQQLHPKGWGESVVNRQSFNDAKKKINQTLAKLLTSTSSTTKS